MKQIHWDKFNAINKRTSNGLCIGEVKELSDADAARINEILVQMDKLSEELYTKFDVARNLFKNR